MRCIMKLVSKEEEEKRAKSADGFFFSGSMTGFYGFSPPPPHTSKVLHLLFSIKDREKGKKKERK